MKLANILVYGGSFLVFLLYLSGADSWAVTMGTVPFFLLLLGAVHELGHCAGCCLTGSPILEVRLPLLRFAEGKFSVSGSFSPLSYCAFRKGRSPWLVYLLGPVFSLAFWVPVFLLSRLYPSDTLRMGSILAFVIAIGNLIPFGRNDMAMILREILYRNEKHT